eukprot:TRINITY_DN3490_c0_g2_i1.p1 TRINITY_DN3490_c0_g2~~TRINITY_DN3490_c0_g2_i1.p1  ORF type:complete len:725 (-),score=127.75 TRINITY_DN3490_c0_g2_i1:414-2534(-)
MKHVEGSNGPGPGSHDEYEPSDGHADFEEPAAQSAPVRPEKKHHKRSSVASDSANPKQQSHGSDACKSTFVDAAAMKEKVRQNLSKPQHVVSDYYKTKGVCQLIAKSQKFDKLTLVVIALNAGWIAVDTDYNFAKLLLEAHPVFILAENLFCAFFSFEWFTRYMSFRRKRDGLKDVWFVFDSFMVGMMVLETWCFTLFTLLLANDSGDGGSTGILRVARVLRLTRMARMARLLRAMPELMIMCKGMMAATRSVFFTLCLLLTIMYVFGIAFKQLSLETPFGDKHFHSVSQAMFTLLVYGTFLDNVGLFATELTGEPLILNMLFLTFVLLGSLTVMNMLVGVLCEVVSAVAATEQEEMLVTYVNDKLSKVMSLLDTDGGGTISKKEFIEILDNVDAVRCLNDVGVDVFGLVDLADYIFEDDDSSNEEEVELDFSKFMEVVLQLRGTNQATVKDIVDLRKFMRQAMMENYRQTTTIIDQLKEGADVTAELIYKTDVQRAEVTRVVSFLTQNIPEDALPVAPMAKNTTNGVVVSCTAYEVEGGPLPLLPPQTSEGQLLGTTMNDAALHTSSEPGHSEVGGSEGIHLKGDWYPFQSEKCLKDWAIPPEDMPAFVGGHKLPTQEPFDKFAVGRHPLLSQSLDDFDMEAIQEHIDLMCRHLKVGLNELLQKFQNSIHKASPRKPDIIPGMSFPASGLKSRFVSGTTAKTCTL